MEFDILYAIQSMHTPVLDQIILFINTIAGDYGQIWPILGVILLIFKKTRKAGICILTSYALVYAVGQFGLKDIVARPRPCHIDETIELLVKRPGSYSFPSTHSAWAFAAATSIFLYHKKAGIAAFVVAIIIGFVRLYLFVHFPTDVLAGIVMGAVLAIISSIVINKIAVKIQRRIEAK